MVGSAITRCLRDLGYENLILRTHAELDLAEQEAVRDFFRDARPEIVIDAAARVGGILANRDYPAEFIRQNLAIQTNVIHEAWHAGVRRLLFLGSSCIYPRDCPQPIREEYLLTGPLELTNRPYALAKICGAEMCWSYNRQHGTEFLAAMPTNVYGPFDNYDLETSHVLPALLRKTHEAMRARADSVQVWGTGQPLREFIHSDDLARACIFLVAMESSRLEGLLRSTDGPPLINIGTGEEISIVGLAEMVCEVVGFKGAIRWDPDKPDGTPRKCLDVSRMHALGWRAMIGLREGIRRTYEDFQRRPGVAGP